MRILVVAVTIILLAAQNQLAQSEQLVPLPDLTDYENLGFFGSYQSTLTSVAPELREALWGRWKNQHRAYVICRFLSREGQRSTTYYYVKPDEDGRWGILRQMVRSPRFSQGRVTGDGVAFETLL